MAHSMQQNHAKIGRCQAVIAVQPWSKGLCGQILVSDWLFSLLCLPQTMESSVTRGGQWHPKPGPVYTVILWVAGGRWCKRIRGERYLCTHQMTLPYLTLPYLTLPYLTLPYVTLRYVTLRYLTLPYLTLRYLTLPYLKYERYSENGHE